MRPACAHAWDSQTNAHGSGVPLWLMRARSVGSALIAACLLLSFLVLTPEARGATPPRIQPGEYSESGGAGCTLNFIFRSSSGATYVGTAAHCVPDGRGADVELSDGTVFGDAAVIGDEDATETDWALIRVRTAYLSRVSAAVKGHPTMPRGVTTPSQTQFGDYVQQSGYGMGFDLTGPTRERRTGILTYDDTKLFTIIAASVYGDSGGPVVHKSTGKALGIVSRLCFGTCEMEGPTVQSIIAQAARKGLTVRLRTV